MGLEILACRTPPVSNRSTRFNEHHEVVVMQNSIIFLHSFLTKLIAKIIIFQNIYCFSMFVCVNINFNLI